MNTYITDHEKYGDIMTMEQMRIVCHISKRKAAYLLQKGLVPCINTGKKTHTYIIKKRDVKQYLLERDVYPDKYLFSSSKTPRKPVLMINDLIPEESMRKYYAAKISDYPDLLITEQICDFTGYGKEAVYCWIRKGELKHLDCVVGYRYPKKYLIDFLCSDYCNKISRKSEKHLIYLSEMIN